MFFTSSIEAPTNGIVNETGSSTSSTPFAIGNLEDLIDWAKNVDDVDYYEYHRNNLIYNNYGMNRNPFIDFPEWIDSVWGNGDAADPEHDALCIPTKVNVPHEPINTTEEEPPEELVQDENNTDLKSSILGFDNGDRVTNFAIDDFTEITFAKNEGSYYPAYYQTGLSLRAYGGNTITFSSTRKIVHLVLAFGSGDGENTITSDDSLFSETSWSNPEGDKEIVLNIEGTTGHRRISRIHITYEDLVPTERILSQDAEEGLQLKYRGTHWNNEVWLDWQNFNYKNDIDRESLLLGISGDVHTWLSLSDFLSLSYAFLWQHHGGELDTLTTLPLDHWTNSNIGINYMYVPKCKNIYGILFRKIMPI